MLGIHVSRQLRSLKRIGLIDFCGACTESDSFFQLLSPSHTHPLRRFTINIQQMKYPATRRDETVVEDLHGHKIADPYRWLENPDSPETAAWVTAQNEVTHSYLRDAEPLRPSFQSTVENLLNYDKFSCAWKRGSYFYYYHHHGLSNQAVIMQTDSIDGEPRVFLDPNKLADDGTVSLGTISWSKNGEYLAFGTHSGGSDWEDITIMKCDTQERLPETLEWAKFTTIAWTKDSKGFYYARYPTPSSLKGVDDKGKRGAETDEAANQSVYYHTIGTPQSQDRLVYEDPENPKRMYRLKTTLDGSFLLIYVEEDCAPKNQIWYVDLSKHIGREIDGIVKLIDETYESQFTYIANDESLFYFMTNWKAPKNRIISVSLENPGGSWTEIVPEHIANVMSTALAVNYDQLAIVYMEDASDRLSVHSLKNGKKAYDIELPDLGSVSITGDRENEFFMYKFTSFLYAGIVYFVDLTLPVGDGTRVFRKMDPPGFDPSKFQTQQVFYNSKDGTKIPMFVIGPDMDCESESPQKRPCLLYGYGGFMISLTPSYSARWAAWMKCLNGTVAIANIRGGDEYGSEWHDQGIHEKKQNVFDDFQWGAKHLCETMQITEPRSLMIMGGSNGGLLVGACVNQAPELYGAAVAQVGVHDILRFHKFTIGSAWVSDYGNPDNPKDFEYQIKYSPLHNVFSPDVRGVPYPATLLTTGDHDDRVVPLHTLKFGAQLQYKAGSSNIQEGRPLLVRIDVKAGHGAGKPTTKIIAELVDTLLFASLSLKRIA